MSNQDYHDMRLTGVLALWLKEQEWEDEVEIEDDRQFSRVRTHFDINDQAHRLFLECNERAERFFVYLYSPLKMPVSRIADTAIILNRINMRITLGRFACRDDGESQSVQFKSVIDVEGAEFATEQISNMASAAVEVFQHYGEVFTALALTKKLAKEIWDDFLNAEEEAEKRDNSGADNAPLEL